MLLELLKQEAGGRCDPRFEEDPTSGWLGEEKRNKQQQRWTVCRCLNLKDLKKGDGRKIVSDDLGDWESNGDRAGRIQRRWPGRPGVIGAVQPGGRSQADFRYALTVSRRMPDASFRLWPIQRLAWAGEQGIGAPEGQEGQGVRKEQRPRNKACRRGGSRLTA